MAIIKADTAALLKRIERLARSIWHEHYTPIIGAGQVAYMLKHFQSMEAMQKQVDNGFEYYLLSVDGQDLGYLGFQEEGKELFLSKVYLQKAMRGQGYGRLMITFVEEQLEQRQLDQIRLTVNKFNTASIRAYEKMGFHRTRALVQEIGQGYVMDDFEYVKSIVNKSGPSKNLKTK